MLILALDTSGDVCSVAVTRENKLLSEYNFAHNRKLTERIPGIVEFVLQDAGVTLTDIELFAVGIGPGSFTGVRVGVTMAKTWAEVFQKPLIGISSLEAMAADTGRTEESEGMAVVVLSRKGEVIAMLTDRRGPLDESRHSEPMILPTTDLYMFLFERFGDVQMNIAGEGARFELDWFHCINAIKPGAKFYGLKLIYCFPRAFHVATLAYYRRDKLDDPAQLTPLYVAPPRITMPKPL